MARAGVYRTDVEKARRALMAQGKHPSIDLVRATLGNTGSRTTIHRLLKEIEADEGVSVGARIPISESLQSLVDSLASQLQKEADERIEEQRGISQAKINESNARARALEQELTSLRSRLQDLETSLGSERTAHEATTDQLQQAHVQMAQLQERLTAQERREREQAEHLESLEEKHEAARDALEHFRNAAKEQREREQRQHDQAVQILQVELRQAAEQLNAKNTDLIHLNRDNSRLLEHTNRLQQEVRSVASERDAARLESDKLAVLPARVQQLETDLAKSAAEQASVKETIEQKDQARLRLQEELGRARVELAAAVAELAGMRAMVGALEHAKSSASDPQS
ncbi:DNA-binding protein [Pseudomarimonas arenosa]|uniref:DNA-binding protein n=1 Tax=Pseudomarimonas arenosa TaxID=2774145 RepID=A0AAW3ZH95_9GAMM|nr:DNA-binding protein [Pseudomarimonas arenosa]MBD8524372.1 DNA-binding protein [Pseudomarimonas arenosa]